MLWVGHGNRHKAWEGWLVRPSRPPRYAPSFPVALRAAAVPVSITRTAMTPSTFELHVQLRHIKPAIWRTLEVPGAATLEDVHYAIQVAMGWQNSHLHEFRIGRRRYGMSDVDEFGELGPIEDERAHALQDVTQSGARFLYTYDFGDGWEHDVTVKRVSSATKRATPRCLDGERACPPEDCGGAPGYANLLTVLADPKHEEHEEIRQWVPRGFDPERCMAKGKDLSRDMATFKRLAEDGDDDLEEDWDVDPEGSESLPPSLVTDALALSPVQRAHLIAILAGSMAYELTNPDEEPEPVGTSRAKGSKKPATRAPRGRGGRRGA